MNLTHCWRVQSMRLTPCEFDGQGLMLLAKRLEHGRFIWHPTATLGTGNGGRWRVPFHMLRHVRPLTPADLRNGLASMGLEATLTYVTGQRP